MTQPEQPIQPVRQIVSIEGRRSILQQEIASYLSRGFMIASQTDTSAQLRKPKKFSFFWSVFLLIFGLGIGFIVYLLFYAAKRDELVYIEVNDIGAKSYKNSGGVSPAVWLALGVIILLSICGFFLIAGSLLGAIAGIPTATP